MTKSLNQKLFYLGVSLLLLFILGVIVKGYLEREKGDLLLVIHNGLGDNRGRPVEGLKDPKDRVHLMSYNLPDERIKLNSDFFYVLYKMKSKEILGVSEDIDSINKILMGKKGQGRDTFFWL